MRIELLPLVLGLLAVGIGIALVIDAATPDGTFISVERRRGSRPPRNCLGEGLLGAAIILLGASLIGRDSWPYTTLSVLIAVALGAAGVALNWHYLRDMAVAPERRSGESSLPAEADEARAPSRDQLISDEQSPASLS
jgi:hypothetical protein